MKKYVRSSDSVNSIYEIEKAMKQLRDVMDDAPSDIIDRYDLGTLYEELLGSIQALDYEIYPHTEY